MSQPAATKQPRHRREALRIPGAIYEAMVAHCQREAPLEACGILCGSAPEVRSIFPLRNMLASERRFSADPKDLIEADRLMRERGEVIVAIFHSHPRWKPVPSKTDLELNFHGTTPQVIVSLLEAEPQVRVWRLHPKSYRSLLWRIVGPDVEPAAKAD